MARPAGSERGTGPLRRVYFRAEARGGGGARSQGGGCWAHALHPEVRVGVASTPTPTKSRRGTPSIPHAAALPRPGQRWLD